MEGEKVEVLTDFIFLGSKITADGDCSHKIKRYLLLGRKTMTNHQFIQLLSRVQLFAILWTAACQDSLPSPTPRACSNSCPLSQWCHPTISSSVIPLSGSFPMIQFFTSGGQSIGVQLQHQSFQWTPGLISLRMDWLDRLAVQGTLKSLLQHHSSKASMLRCSAFFIVQLSRPYMSTGKTTALTKWIFVGIVMSLLFNMLSRLVITFLPRSKHLLISWLQSPSAVIFEPRK